MSAIRFFGCLRGRPAPGKRGTRMASSTAPSCVLSWHCLGVTKTESGRPLPSQARCSLGVSPPRLRPSASSSGCSTPFLRRFRRETVVRPRRAGGRGPRCRLRSQTPSLMRPPAPPLPTLPVEVAAVQIVYDHDRKVLDHESPYRLRPKVFVGHDLRLLDPVCELGQPSLLWPRSRRSRAFPWTLAPPRSAPPCLPFP